MTLKLGLGLGIVESGGGAPAWLPEGAVIFADFVNGNYYYNGASQIQADFITLNHGSIDAGGLLVQASATVMPALKSAILTQINNDLLATGFSAVFNIARTDSLGGSSAGVVELNDTSNPVAAVESIYVFVSETATSIEDFININKTVPFAPNLTGVSKVGMTLSKPSGPNFTFSVTIDGNAVGTGDLADSLAARYPGGIQSMTVGGSIQGGGPLEGRLQSFYILAPVSDAQLQALTA